MSGPSMSAGMRELVLQLARHRRGLALLHLAEPECTAVTLGVDACIVADAHDALATPEGRAQLIAAVRQARREIGAGAHPGGTSPLPPPPRTACDLVHAAAESAYGIEFLRSGSLESAAVIFRVHPNRVLRARTLLQRHAALRARSRRT